MLLRADRLRLFAFNRTAHLLWRVLCRGDASCLPAVLASRYGLSMDVAERDADAIVQQWIANGLLVEAGDPAVAPQIEQDSSSEFFGPTIFRRLRVGSLVFSIEAPVGLIQPFWLNMSDDPEPPDVACRLEMATNGRGRLVVDDDVVLDDVPWYILIGGLYRTVISRLHPAASICAVIHAGAVAINGRAALLAAPSGSGKSTLTAYLVSRGFDYLSDDLAPLLSDHSVAPFPLPISVKPGSAKALKPFYGALDASPGDVIQSLPLDVGFDAPARPATALIFPRYVAGSPTCFEKISTEEAITRMLNDQLSLGYPIDNKSLVVFLGWIKTVECRVLIYSEFEEAERCLKQILKA